MHHIGLVSAKFMGAGYDNGVMEVVHRNAEVYRYENVPIALWSKILNSQPIAPALDRETRDLVPVSISMLEH
jgi:hypothetical protein